MPHKFGSNLGFKSSGNSVNMVNSNRGSHLTDDELLLRSGRRRGHLRLHAGVEKAPMWLLFASWSRFKPRRSRRSLLSPPLFFQSPQSLLRRACDVAVVPLPSRQSLSQLRLLLANLVHRALVPDFAEERRSLPFFLASGNITVACASPWPSLYGEPLLLRSLVSASP